MTLKRALASAVACLVVSCHAGCTTYDPPINPSVRVPVATASQNKGRAGTYFCRTANPLYGYFVRVPKSYSEENPAGIHLYFHGNTCQGTAEPYLDYWAKYFLEPHNLIGIDVQYLDGIITNDVEGKAAAAMEAVRQVTADYKIIRGRGVIASHSAGGSVHGFFIEQYGWNGLAAGSWLFNHSAAYGTDFPRSMRKTVDMSWFLGFSDGEWSWKNICPMQLDRAAELFDEARAGRCPDIRLKVTRGQGHWKKFEDGQRWLDDRDAVESAKGFARSDLAFCAFLYEPDFPEPSMRPIVRAANRLELGRAYAATKRLLADPKTPDSVLRKARVIEAKINARADADLALSKDLAANDPVLWGYYGKIFRRQLAGHPREAELGKLRPPTAEQEKDAEWALGVLGAHLNGFFTENGKLKEDAVEPLTSIRQKLGPNSTLGRMAGECLQCR